METKFCKVCEKHLPIGEFYKNKSSKDGLQYRCKGCLKDYEKKNKQIIKKRQKKWRDENKSDIKEYNAKYRKENKEKLSAQSKDYYRRTIHERRKYNRKYYLKNKEEEKERVSKWYEENKEHVLEYSREHGKKWRKYNKDKIRLSHQRRKARKQKLPRNLTLEQWEDIKEAFDGRCAYCGEKKKLEQEHFIALSNGGEYTINNIIPACRSCNASKNDKDFFEWYPLKEFYSKNRERKVLNYLKYNKNKEQQLSLM